jgi:hypothetical protein
MIVLLVDLRVGARNVCRVRQRKNVRASRPFLPRMRHLFGNGMRVNGTIVMHDCSVTGSPFQKEDEFMLGTYSRGWGYYPSGTLGLVVIVLVVLAVAGRI